MRAYIAKTPIAADRPFAMAAVELNQLIAPLELIVTDRFDEVPGYIAGINSSVYVELQGIPDDLDEEQSQGEVGYYLTVQLSLSEGHEIPAWLGELQSEQLPKRNGYFDFSKQLRSIVSSSTNLKVIAE